MDPDRHRRATEILHYAERLEGDEQEAYVLAACCSDEQLLREVRRLLRWARETPDSFLEPARPDDAASRPQPLQKGQALAHYRIVEKLGEGGMGEVYRAEDTTLGRQVALKVLPAELAASAERLERLRREAEALAAVDDPSIVTVHSFEEADGLRFLTMQLLEGKTLDESIAEGRMSPSRSLDVAIQLTNALAAAHGRGVVHRDLKPGNIMVGEDGRVRVLDFGLAKRTDGAGITRDPAREHGALTGRGAVLGTVAYMAPEQLRGEPAHEPADIWALGVVLYEMALGERPFGGNTEFEVSAAILSGDPPIPPDVPPPLGELIERCLEKAPGRRPSAEALKAQLEAARQGLPSSQRPVEGTTADSTPRWAAGSSRRRVSAALGLTAAAALVAALWLTTRTDAPVGAENQPGAGAVGAATSIAVLPFADLSPERDHEYFADGLAEEILNVLAQFEGLKVAARTSSFSLKGEDIDAAAIGEQLGVETLLSGSVRKAGDQLRITTQLVNASDGFHIWAKSYELRLDDIFAVQDEIARSVAEALQLALLAEPTIASRPPGASVEAYNLYLKARHLTRLRRNADDFERSLRYAEQALQLDAEYAPAWVALAYARCNQVDYGFGSREENLPGSLSAIHRALELDETRAEGWAVLGEIKMELEWDWAAAEAALARARALEPDNPEVLRRQGELARALGRIDEAIALSRRAIERDPLNALPYNILASDLVLAGRLGEAAVTIQRLDELNPVWATMSRARWELESGRPETAHELVESLPPGQTKDFYLAQTLYAVGRQREADLAAAEYVRRNPERRFFVARLHAFRGEDDEAFRWLDKAFDHRDPQLRWAKARPEFRILHDDPRWVHLMVRMNLPAP